MEQLVNDQCANIIIPSGNHLNKSQSIPAGNKIKIDMSKDKLYNGHINNINLH